jgi:hypothetical protein
MGQNHLENHVLGFSDVALQAGLTSAHQSLPSSMISSRAYSLTLLGLFCHFLFVLSWPGLFFTQTSLSCYKNVPFQVPTKVQFPLLPLTLSPLQTMVTLPLELSQFPSGVGWTFCATCSSKTLSSLQTTWHYNL